MMWKKLINELISAMDMQERPLNHLIVLTHSQLTPFRVVHTCLSKLVNPTRGGSIGGVRAADSLVGLLPPLHQQMWGQRTYKRR